MSRRKLIIGLVAFACACGGAPFVEVFEDPPVVYGNAEPPGAVASAQAEPDGAPPSVEAVADPAGERAPASSEPPEAAATASSAPPVASVAEGTAAAPAPKALLLDGKACDELKRLARAEVDELFDPSEEHLRSFRVVPVRTGEPDGGLRLAMLREGSLLWRWGFRQGDEILRLDDASLAEPEQALEALAALRTATSVRVELRRDSKPRFACFQIE